MQKVAWEQYQESKPLFSGQQEPKQRLELLRTEILGKARDELAVPGKFTPEMESCEKRINTFDKDVREKVIENLADMTPDLIGDVWCCLVDAAVGDDAENRQTALRKLIIPVPTGEINSMLDNITLTMRMRKLTNKNQWKELAVSSKNVDFSKWPRCLALGAFRMRAAANFNNSSDYYNLACNYEQNLKNDKKALEAYLKAAKISREKKEPGRYENPVKD